MFDDVFVAGNGAVYIAPVGTPLPTSALEPLDFGFRHLGLTTEDGVSLRETVTFRTRTKYPSRQPTSRSVQRRETEFACSLLEWNDITLLAAFGGGTWTALTGTQAHFVPPTGSSIAEWAVVVDAIDEQVGTRKRFVAHKMQITSGVTTRFSNQDASTLPISFAPTNEAGTAPWELLEASELGEVLVLVGEGPPSGLSGFGGDVYMDSITGRVYQYSGPFSALDPTRDPGLGFGAPSGNGRPGDAYIDLDAGDLWMVEGST